MIDRQGEENRNQEKIIERATERERGMNQEIGGKAVDAITFSRWEFGRREKRKRERFLQR